MKNYQKLYRFPLGAIHAKGYLQDQMLLGKDGMSGHLYELEPEMLAAPFIRDFHVPTWTSHESLGWGAEIAGSYWNGYIQFAFTLNDAEMIAIATKWVNDVLAKQREDGYLGTYYHEGDLIHDDYNAWGTACAARGLIAFYEATQRKDVLDALHRAMLWFCQHWAGDQKTCYAGGFIIEPMIAIYHLTQDQRLLDFSEDYLDFLCRNNIFGNSYKQMLEDSYHYNANHTAGLGNNVRLPALVYTATGNEEYLQATLKRLQKFREKSLHVTGAPVSPNEYLGPVSSTADSEYCGFAFFNASYSYLSAITGEAKYGDYMEQQFYNAAQGARKKDEKAIAYMSAPNQIYATDHSSAVSHLTDGQVYAPCYPVSCCPVNSVAVVPEFIRGMFLRDAQDNVYVTVYGPSELKYQDLHVVQKTLYPFRNQSVIEILCNKEFSLALRIPQWAEGYSVRLNGEIIEVAPDENGYTAITRAWESGDVVQVDFQASVKVVTVDDSDAGSKYPLAVTYGPLVYAYHVPEDWRAIPGRPTTPLPEGWSWYNVYPKFEEADVEDFHEKLGLRKKQFSWNIALDESLCADDFTIEEVQTDGYVWSNPPIRLHTHCYKAPDLNAPYQEKTVEPFGRYQYVTDKLPLTLVPYGCTNLRITYFPRADLKNK